jgi:cytochrome c-type biogenesis protein CcsB
MNYSLEFVFLIIAFVVALAALWAFSLAYFFKWKENTISLSSQILLSIVFTSLVFSLVLRSVSLGRFPISNLYETLILFASAISGIYLFLSWRYKLNYLAWPACVIVLGLLIYAGILPVSQREVTPLLPSLQSYWRPIHVPPLLVSYAFFALAAITAALYLIEGKFSSGDKTERLAFYQEAIYRCVSFGFPLLTFGIVTGALWANHSWGNLWQWDPKENLALVTWFCYAAYLHLRLTGKASGSTLAWIVIGGIGATYMTYLGINQFNLGGLHTYGQV